MLRILVVDDSLFMRKKLKGIIEKAGHVVVDEATNGNDALYKYIKSQPNLVIMDITMPEVDGLEGLKKIMSVDNNARVIMCSAIGQEPFIKEAIDNGALDYIVKPFRKEQVLYTINRVLEMEKYKQ
jgi:two-component system chemotaxis response regulator CheY